MNSIRERLVQEVIRRLEVGEFQTVEWASVIRTELPDDYDASQGALLAVLEGRENLAVDTSGRQNSLSLFLSFAVPLAPGEVPQTVANNVAGEIANALHGNKSLEEGGDGTGGVKLSANFRATAVEPDLINTNSDCAAATVEFEVAYRTRTANQFELA